MFKGFKSLIKEKSAQEKGASAVEYALIAGLIAVAIIIAVDALGGDVSGVFERISTELTTPAQ